MAGSVEGSWVRNLLTRLFGWTEANGDKSSPPRDLPQGAVSGAPPEESSAEDVVAGQRTSDGEERIDIDEVIRENEELRQRIEHIHAKYVKTDIVADKDLAREKEIAFLRSKVKEQHEQLGLARNKLKTMLSFQEIVQSQRAKIGMLNSMVDHQARLLRSLTAGNPKHEELVSTVERLRVENTKLKSELARLAELLAQLRMTPATESRQALEELITRNIQLQAGLEDKETQLESVAGGSEEDLLTHIERLSEKNIQLKSMVETKESIDSFIRDQTEGKGAPDLIIEELRVKNQQLEQALSSKEEEIRALTAHPANSQLWKAYTRLRGEYKEVYQENQLRSRFHEDEFRDKQSLIAQARERTSIIKENQRLRSEIENSKRLGEVLRKSELQCQALKKDRFEILSKYEAVLAQLDKANKKIIKLTAEYGLLIKEYETIFNR